jgi:hypothetical protein
MTKSTMDEEDITKLLLTLEWAADKLGKLIHHRCCAKDEFTQRNLRTIRNALLPETNPKIAPIFKRYR